MKTKFSRILTLFLAFAVQLTFAQQKTVSGVVTDENGLPLPGATVLVVGTTNGVATDFDGKYTIAVETGKVLRFSYVGYATQNVTVGASNTINMSLAADNTLDEVIITALGLEKKKDDDLSSSTTIDSDAVSRSKEAGIIAGLAGKTSGLKITKNSGDPGAGAYIQIRGQNTILGSSSPLVILDGVPISNSNVGGGTGGVSQQSRLNDISSEDIANITVLKGAAAAAVWGTGAANGVLIITTKKGKIGKVTVNIKSSVIVDEINVEFDKQDKYGQGFNGSFIEGNALSWGDKIADRPGGSDFYNTSGAYFAANNGNIIYPISQKRSRETFNEENRNQVFGTGITLDNSVSVSFGSEKSRTYLSYSNWDQNGIIKGQSSYKRQTFRINNEVDLSDDITAKVHFNYSRINADRIQRGSNIAGLYLGYLRTPTDFNNTLGVKGNYINSAGIPSINRQRAYRNPIGANASPAYNNPGWTINEQGNPNEVERFIINPEINWKMNDNMTLTARYGIDYYTDFRGTFYPVNSGDFPTGYFNDTEIREKTQNLNIFVQSKHDISEDFNLGWILGTALDRNEYKRLSGTSQEFTNPIVDDLRIFGNAEAQNETPSSYKEETRKSGLYAVISTELFNQLFIELSGRYERPSTLESNLFYPSASIGWKFSELIGVSDFFSFGKLRASYGEVGIEPQPYSTTTLVSPGGTTSGWGDNLSAASFGNPFEINNELGNPNLKEERIKEYEVGADLRFLNNKLTLGITYYDRVTEDALLDIDVPSSSGYGSTSANVAEIKNSGLEVDLDLKLLTEGDFKWSLNTNFSYNKNKVTDLAGVQSVFLAGFTSVSSRVVEGEAIGALWGTSFARNNDGSLILDSNGFPTIETEEGVLGDPNPDWIGGLGTVLSWKGITLSAQFETSQGNDHWTGSEGVLKYFGIHPETANESVAPQNLNVYQGGPGDVIPSGTTFRGNVADFGGGPVALTQSWYLAEGGGFGNQGETFIKDASWTRLRELSIGYDFPDTVISKLGLTNLSFTLTGRNLVLWTEIEGFDPDLNLTGASKGRGLEYFNNPATKSLSLTLNLGF